MRAALVLSLSAALACGHEPAEHEARLASRAPDASAAAPPRDVPVRSPHDGGVPDGGPTDGGVPDGGARLADAGGIGVGLVGTLGSGGARCSIPALPAETCSAAPAASRVLAREVERFLKRVAFQNTSIASEWADVVRARSVRVGLAERTDTRLRVVAAFVADRGGSYRDTRGSRDPAPVDAGATPTCVELSFVAEGTAYVLEPPHCVANLGHVPTFRPKPVTP